MNRTLLMNFVLIASLAASAAIAQDTEVPTLANPPPPQEMIGQIKDSAQQPQLTPSGGVFYDVDPVAAATPTQKRAAAALQARYPDATLVSMGGGTNTRRGPSVKALVVFGPAGFMAGRFKTEVVCTDVSIKPDEDPVTAMFFISPKTQRGVLVVDTPISDAACTPPKDHRRTRAGQKAFRDLMEENDAYSKNVFRTMFGN